MKNRELAKQALSIRELLKNTGAATDGDLELQAHWAKYLCVLVSGFLENSLQLLFSDFIENSTPQPVAKFAINRIRQIQNPRASRFFEVARSFKEHWGDDLENFASSDGRSDAIDAIMTARHQIAHGKDSNISIARLTGYFDKAVEVVEFLEKKVSS